MKDNPPRDYVFWTCCVYSVGQLIDEMTDADVSKDVTYETMLKHADGMLEKADELGYDRRSTQGAGVTLKNDWAVSFHRSTYCGVPCYYFVYSGIEYIWIQKGREAEVQDCEEAARAAARPATSLLASVRFEEEQARMSGDREAEEDARLRMTDLIHEPKDNPADPSLFANIIIPDSSWYDPDELWGRPMVHGDPGCDITKISVNPPPEWLPLTEFHWGRRALEAQDILNSYGIKLSSNLKTYVCLSLTRNMSCQMTAWCEHFCYGKSQNFCRPNTVNSLLKNFDAFEFLAGADQQTVEDVAWAIMTVCLAFGIPNLRVPGVGDFTPGLLRVCDAMTAADPNFTVWGFTRKHDFAFNEMPIRDNLVIWASIDASMSDKRLDQAIAFAAAHQTGLSYSTELGEVYQPRDGKNPEPPWWNPPLHPNQERDREDTFLADFVQHHDLHVVFGYHGKGMTTHVGGGCPECPATDPLGGAHFVAACQECYWCAEKPSRAAHLDLVEHRLNTVGVIRMGKHQGTRVLLDTGERV